LCCDPQKQPGFSFCTVACATVKKLRETAQMPVPGQTMMTGVCLLPSSGNRNFDSLHWENRDRSFLARSAGRRTKHVRLRPTPRGCRTLPNTTTPAAVVKAPDFGVRFQTRRNGVHRGNNFGGLSPVLRRHLIDGGLSKKIPTYIPKDKCRDSVAFRFQELVNNARRLTSALGRSLQKFGRLGK